MNARISRVALVAVVMSAGCVGDAFSTIESSIAGPPVATITTDSSSYVAGQNIQVTWDQLPGNASDWVGLAPSGSEPTSVVKWVSTGGASSSSYTFSGLANGTFVARAFAEDTYTVVAESNEFSVGASGASITTSQSTYAIGQSIDVTWAGTPLGAMDWVAIAPAGSSTDTLVKYIYTNGVDGSHTFTGLTVGGSYVARVFANDTYNLLAESSTFTVGSGVAAVVSTNATAYGVGADVVVTWSGLSTSPVDWIALAPQGSSLQTTTRWVYTGGAASGSFSFEGPATGGAYVARAFANDTYTIVGESALFTVGSELVTNAASYDFNDQITVTWSNLPSNAHDWIALAPQGSQNDNVLVWVYTNGAASGSTTFNGFATAGNYVARAFLDDTYTLISESTAFSVGAGAGAEVTTDLATYTIGQDVVVSWTGLPSNASNWVAIAPAGSSNSSVVQWVYTGTGAAGSATFSTNLAAGTYVARVFFNDSYALLDESPTFDVQ